VPGLSSPPRRLGTLALILASALAAGCGGGGHRAAPPSSRRPLVSIFEAPTQLAADPGATLEQLRRLGVQYVRVLVQWRLVAPSPSSARPPANFNPDLASAYRRGNWATYDAIDRDARAEGIGVLFDIDGPAPSWATGPGFIPGGTPGVWRPSAAGFEAFARAVGRRYGGRYTPPGASSPLPRVSFWSIWNEPNLGEAELAPQAIDDSRIEASAVMYRGLLDAGWSALQATGHGGDRILIGDLAPLGQTVGTNVPGNFGEMVPLRFARALYCVDGALRPLRGAAAAARGCPTTAAGRSAFPRDHPALFDATGFAIHPYPGPTRVPPTTVLGSDFATLANLSKLEGLLTTVSREYGHPRPWGIWNTEYGYITDPPFAPGAPLALAAAYENWAEYLSWREDWMRSFDHYLLVDPPVGGPSHFFTGLEFSNPALTHKPTYRAFRMPLYLPDTRAPQGRPLEVWGCVRPVNDTASPPPAEIQLQPGGRGAFKTVRSVAMRTGRCYFDLRVRFPSGGEVRLAWSFPGGPTVYSRAVAIGFS
jgi:hypothetical protein